MPSVDPPPSASKTPGARLRQRRLFGGAMIAAAALGPLLMVNALYSQQAVRQAAEALLRQEAVAWGRAVRAHFFRLREPPRAETLATWLEESQDEGLRYVGFFTLLGEVQAGQPLGSLAEDPAEPEGFTWVGDRVRVRFSVIDRRGGRRPRRPEPPPRGPGPEPPILGPRGAELPSFGGPRGPDPDRGPGRRLGFYVVEFEPTGYKRLLGDARRTLVLGVLSSVTVVLLAAWAWGAMRRRQALEARAAHAQHLAALGEMSAVLAHEIRNPLASLKGHAQLLCESLSGPGLERPNAKAARVVDEAVRIERITTDLLDFVRGGELATEDTDLGALVQQAVADVVPPERLRLDLPAEPLRRPVDPGRLRQVIENLARNGVQAGDGAVEIAVRQQAGGAQILVRDHGPGIPAEQAERIFEPFVTTRTRGTGLGLSIARRIAERHGGTLTGRNHLEGGAIFELTLPERAG